MPRVPLAQLGDWNVVDEKQDIRGLRLQDEAGNIVGLITEMIVDTDAGYVDAILLDTGAEVSTDDIEIGQDLVVLRRATPQGGTRPTAAMQSATPPAAAMQQGTTTAGPDRVESLRVPVVEESLHVGKREVETGGFRVTSQVREEPVRQDVRLREERVHVERAPVHRPLEEGDGDAFQEGTYEIRAYGEKLDIGKQAFVVEEIRINKDVVEHTETVQESVRRTAVTIEELPGQPHAMERGEQNQL